MTENTDLETTEENSTKELDLSPQEFANFVTGLRIIHDIAVGKFRSVRLACQAHDVPSTTFNDWWKKGLFRAHLESTLVTLREQVFSIAAAAAPAAVANMARKAIGSEKGVDHRDQISAYREIAKIAGVAEAHKALSGREARSADDFLKAFVPKEMLVITRYEGAPKETAREKQPEPPELPELALSSDQWKDVTDIIDAELTEALDQE